MLLEGPDQRTGVVAPSRRRERGSRFPIDFKRKERLVDT